MRQVYAHQAVVISADERAPGAAVTVALCGQGEHEPPCPLAPHHTVASPAPSGGEGGDGSDRLGLRILFATEPHRADEVRALIDTALAGGDWELISSGCARIDAADRPHARRLLRTNRAITE